MTEQQREEWYRELAKAYTAQDGETLRAENEDLNHQGVEYLIPRADKAAKRLARAGEQPRMPRRAWGAIAAAVVLLALVPSVLALNGRLGKSHSDMAVSEAAAPESSMSTASAEAEMEAIPEDAGTEAAAGAPDEEAAMEEAESEAAAADAPAAAPEAQDGETGAGAPATPGTGPADDKNLMPLPFSLPENFSVKAAEVDDGQSIYTLQNDLRDDVVLTMAHADDAEAAALFEGLTPYDLDGRPVYLRTSGDYNFLTFAEDGVLYTLSCKHDINTLLALAREM